MTATNALTVRRADERGRTCLAWLDSHHSFSFGHYHDPAHMRFGPLRVINDDTVAPNEGFAEHPHREMEILTWVLEGGLEHRDSLGSGSVIRPGDAQIMSAGTGIRHSEFNASSTEPVRFLQIWIEPQSPGLPPRYEERHFDGATRDGALCLIASPDARDRSAKVFQDAWVYATLLSDAQTVTHTLDAGRRAWVQVATGAVMLNGELLNAGDGASLVVNAPTELALSSCSDEVVSEALLFDLS